MQITLPSGLSFTAREWELGDQGELLSGLDDEDRVLSIVMLQQVVEPGAVIDPGPYHFEVGGDINWNEVTNADITVANFMVRIATDPDVYLQAACASCGSLPTDDGIHVHLPDIEVFPPSDEGMEVIASGSAFPFELESTDGTVTVYLRPIRGKHLSLMTRAVREEESAVLEIQMCMSIDRISMPDGKEFKGLVGVRKFFKRQSWSFGKAIEDKVDELFGGADTSVQFRCHKLACGREQEALLPLDPHFYGLSRKRKRKGGLKLSAVSRSTAKTMPKTSSTSSSEDQSQPTSESPVSRKRRRPRSG